MSPEELSKLRELRDLFVEGQAGPESVRQLSELLAAINQRSPIEEQPNGFHYDKNYNDQ